MKARQFVEFYEKLYLNSAGDAVSIYYWLRASHEGLTSTPLVVLLVDERRLVEVIAWFDSPVAWSVQKNGQIDK